MRKISSAVLLRGRRPQATPGGRTAAAGRSNGYNAALGHSGKSPTYQASSRHSGGTPNPASTLYARHPRTDIVTYSIKEIFYTLQGEGAHAGRPAVFCRFSGCNLWTGREEDRSRAVCQFCDTDFVGTDGENGGKFKSPAALASMIDSLWPATYAPSKYVVFTGGEPLLQLDGPLIDAMHAVGFEIAIETNGTIEVPAGVDWICVSPKMGSELKVRKGSELKVVVPQAGQPLDEYEKLDFQNFLLQPMDGPAAAANTRLAIEMVKNNPKWKLSIQTHKLLNIP